MQYHGTLHITCRHSAGAGRETVHSIAARGVRPDIGIRMANLNHHRGARHRQSGRNVDHLPANRSHRRRSLPPRGLRGQQNQQRSQDRLPHHSISFCTTVAVTVAFGPTSTGSTLDRAATSFAIVSGVLSGPESLATT